MKKFLPYILALMPERLLIDRFRTIQKFLKLSEGLVKMSCLL